MPSINEVSLTTQSLNREAASTHAGSASASANENQFIQNGNLNSAAAPTQERASGQSDNIRTSIPTKSYLQKLGGLLSSGASALQSGITTGLSSASDMASTFSHYMGTLQPAEAHDIMGARKELQTLVKSQIQPSLEGIELRDKLLDADFSALSKLAPALKALPEVQNTFRAIRSEKNANAPLKNKLKATQTKAQQISDALISSPHQRQLRQTQVDSRTLQNQISELNQTFRQSTQDSFRNRSEIQNVVEAVKTLEANTIDIKTLATALHFNTRKADWSAFFQQMADSYLELKMPTNDTLQKQTKLSQDLKGVLEQLVSLRIQVLKTDNTCAKLQHHLQRVLSNDVAPQGDKKLYTSQLQRALQLHQAIRTELKDIEKFATAAVSYGQRPSQHLQQLAQQFTQTASEKLRVLFAQSGAPQAPRLQDFNLAAELLLPQAPQA